MSQNTVTWVRSRAKSRPFSNQLTSPLLLIYNYHNLTSPIPLHPSYIQILQTSNAMFSIKKIFSRSRRNTRRTRYYYNPDVQPLAPILLRSPVPRVLTQLRFWDEGPFHNFPYMFRDEPLPQSDTSLSLPFTSKFTPLFYTSHRLMPTDT